MVETTATLKQKYRDYTNILDKIKREVDSGSLIRLTRGVYETTRDIRPCFLAPVILSPSYLSFEWALSHYGLIPERVVAVTSASLEVHKNKTFTNDFARFTYSDVSSKVFSEGLTYFQEGNHIARIATKEKAICDSLSKWRVVHSIKDLKELMFDDKRIDEDEFLTCNFQELIRLAKLYQKTNLNLLIDFIKKEHLDE